ncbi:hypothetical protein ACFVDH_22040 [Streptomyces sp. NPDC057674]|uniref:hypothetical protein n=1 Tax=Streptomyces sp. NPDC057674 TaxID=3346203 RepID=UPI0036B0054A
MPEREHGTYARYKLDACRCYPCAAAASAYNINRERAIAYGRWQPYVDAEPVRQHASALGEFGIGYKRVAALAGLSPSVVSVLLFGSKTRNRPPSKGVRHQTAQRILAIEPTLDNLGAAVLLDATGTHRRLQALAVAGWPHAHLARALGMSPGNFGAFLRRTQVTVRVARLSRTVYQDLEHAAPQAHGVGNQAYSRARNAAAAASWAPAGAWDEDTIDDPQAYPDWTGACGTPQGASVHYRTGIPTCQPCRDARNAQRRSAAPAA